MPHNFYWDAKSIAVEEDTRKQVEKQIEKALDYSGSDASSKVRPCHQQELSNVHLFQYNPLKNEAYGEIKCCCGDEVARFTVDIDSKEITYY